MTAYSRTRPLVDFIGVGVPKAATSWLFDCLAEHPAVCASADKETSFFLSETFKKGFGWYAGQFAHCAPGTVKGEFTPQYLYYPDVLERIKENIPNARLILVLRNPIERFCSGYYYDKGKQIVQDATVEEYLARKPKKELEKGLYSGYVSRLFSLFPREQVLILLYDDICRNPRESLKAAYRFLGVDETFIPSVIDTRRNITAVKGVRIGWYDRLFKKTRKRILKSALGKHVAPVLRSLGLPKVGWYIYRKNKMPDNKRVAAEKTISEEAARALADYYNADIKYLEGLIGRDLSAWRE